MSGHSSARFRPDIEGMRAIAILLVLLYHAGVPGFGGGFIGVDVFFVLSGYLITRSLLEEVGRSGTIHLREFYARRARRLLPAALLVLIVTAGAVWLVLPFTAWREFGGDIAAASLYFINWRLAARSVDYLAEGVSATPVQHYWSLAVEEQFYLIWPFLMLVAAWLHRRKGWSLARTTTIVLGGVVLVPSLAWSVSYTAASPAEAFFVTTTRLWELAIGAFVAAAGVRLAPNTRLSAAVRSAGLIGIVATAVLVAERVAWPSYWALLPTVATAAVIAAGAETSGSDKVAGLLQSQPMQRIGAWSYSIYLWHWPPLAILAATGVELDPAMAMLVTVVACVPAVLSYRLLENPVRFAKPLVSSPGLSLSLGANLTLCGALVGVLLVMAIPRTAGPDTSDASAVGSTQPLGAEVLREDVTDAFLLEQLRAVSRMIPSPAEAVDDIPPTHADGCHLDFRDEEPKLCPYGAESDITVALVGDSKANQYTSAFMSIAERNGWQLIVATKSACTFSLAMISREGEPYSQCLTWSERLLEVLAHEPPDLVLVSQARSQALTDDSGTETVEALVEGMDRAYRPLVDAGSTVVMLLDNPHPGMQVYECVAEHLDDLEACTFAREDRLHSGGRDAQLLAAERYGYPTIETLDYICPTPTCFPVIGEVLVYRQGSHLTATYVESMAGVLEERIEPFLRGASES